MNDSVAIPQLIVGLGNPGSKYDRTRHNIGFDAVDLIAAAWQADWQQNRRFQGWVAETLAPSKAGKVYLLKPNTFMNRSGQSVRGVLDWYKLSPESVLVVYDDMDLPVGKIRLRTSGSAGGHNGMKSIISHLGSQDFLRLRIGIGKSNGKDETISHVLGKFSPSEKEIMAQVLQLVTDAIELTFKQGFQQAMNVYNGKDLSAVSEE